MAKSTICRRRSRICLIAGASGALIGSIAGAALGFWHDAKENSTRKQLLDEDQIKKTNA